MNVKSLLQELRGKGVTFRIEPGRGLCYSVPGSICGTDAIDRIKQNEAGLLQAVAAEAAGQKGVAVTTRSGRGSAASSAPLDEGQKRTELQRSVRELANAVELGQLALSRIESLEGPEERSAPAPALCNKAFMG